MSAHDPVPGLDNDIRILRYGSLAEALLANGHEVVFWTSTFAHWRKKARYEKDTTVEVSQNLTAEFVFAPPYISNVSIGRVLHNRGLARGFRRKVDSITAKPDLIIAEIPCLELAEAASLYARSNGIPFVCDIQDIWPEVYLTLLPNFLRGVGRRLIWPEFNRLRRILRGASGVTAVSQSYLNWSQRWMDRDIGKNDSVFPLGYERPNEKVCAEARVLQEAFFERLEISHDCMLVTFLGQLATSYDIETIVDAARILQENDKLPDHKIILAGDGDKYYAIRRRAVGLSNIVFTGWLRHTETICLLGASYIGLAAYSDRAAQSLPYKPFEYMAFGLPVVNSLSGELEKIIEERKVGINYRTSSPQSLSSAIARLLTDRSLRDTMSSNARVVFEESFTSKAIYSKMAKYLVEH